MLRVMSVLEPINAAARFVLELCALATCAIWGFRVSDQAVVEWTLGLGATIAFALIWGAFVGPKAPLRLDDPARLVLEVALFSLTAVALAAATSAVLAVVFAAAIVLNISLMLFLGQRRPSGI